MLKRMKWLCSGTLLLSLAMISATALASTTWKQTTEGVGSMAIDPTNSQTLYAGVYNSGVFKSTNGGSTWSAINSGLTNTHITCLVIDTTSPQTVYAGTYDSGVFKTTDGGSSWNAVNSGLTNMNITSLAIDPNSHQTVYAGTYNSGVFKSTDSCSSWDAVSSGLNQPFGSMGTYITCLTIDPTASQIVYVGTFSGVYKSTDGGSNWSNSGQLDIFVSLSIDPINHQTIYGVTTKGSVYKTINGGSSWNFVSIGVWASDSAWVSGGSVLSVALDQTSSQTVYVLTNSGLFKSINGGDSWSAVNNSLTWASFLAIDPTTSQTMYVRTDSGIIKSTDGGGSWSTITKGLLNYSGILSLSIDPTTPQTVYAGTFGGIVFKSTDGGGSWIALSTGLLSDADVQSLVIDPSFPQTVYAGTSSSVFKSIDGGGSWIAADTGLTGTNVSSMIINPITPQTIYAGGLAGYFGVFKSINGGDSWSAVNNGLTNTSIQSLAIDPVSPQTVYAGAFSGGVFKSTNGGGSWIATNNGLPASTYVTSFAIDSTSHLTVYAGTGSGMFKSINGGSSWTEINGGLTNSGYITSLAIDPSIHQIIYAGTTTGGVFKSTDGGGSWNAVNSGLTNFGYIRTLVIDPISTQAVYAGTSLSGVFKGISMPDIPTVSGIPTTTATVGATYSFTPTATNAASFSVTGSIPLGLNFNTTTGTLSGTPTTVGTYNNIIITASNASGSATLSAFTITLLPDSIVPVVTAFTIPASSTSLTVSISTLTATDNAAVTGYLLSETSSAPAASGLGWSVTKPASYTFTTSGTKTLFAWAKDAAGNVSLSKLASVVVTIPDITAPVVTAFTIPATSTNLIVSISSFIATDNVAVTRYMLTETSLVPAASSAGWSTTKPASYAFATNGSKTLYAWARDAAGNISANMSATVTVDTSGPTLTLSTLSNGAVTPASTLNITGVVSDISGVADLSVNGTSVTITNSSFSYPVTLQAGGNTITTIATDILGNRTTDTRIITLDTTAPALTISAPADGSKTAQALATISGTIDETSTVTVIANSGTPQSVTITGSTYSAAVNLESGINTIDITATDLAGNTSTAKRTITYDNTVPSLSISNPAQDISTTQGSIAISGSVADTITSATISITADGVTYTPTANQDGSFSQDIQLPTDKTYAVVVTATDQATNSVTVQRNIIKSTPLTQPTINDALKVLQAVIGITPLTASEQIRYDVAPLSASGTPVGNGVIDAADVILILRRSIGIGSW